jgi:uncharacterized membrane protein YeiB
MLGSTLELGDRAALVSTDPFTRSLLFTASALGTAFAAFGIVSWLAEVNPVSPTVRWLADAGAMSLTLYVLHALIFELLVNQLHWIRPTGLDTALLFAAVYWAVGLAAASWWHRRYGIGPLEWSYRKLGG